MSEAPRVVYRARDFAMPEVELSALGAVYRFVLFDSQASKGGPDDLTKNVTKECTTSPEKKGTDNTDIHRNGL
jgi:hypothetical protein